MSEEFGGNIISITDEEGNSYELEHLDTIEMDGAFYLAFLPADRNQGDEDELEIVILKSEHGEDGDDYLVVPDDDELQRAYDQFMRELFSDDE